MSDRARPSLIAAIALAALLGGAGVSMAAGPGSSKAQSPFDARFASMATLYANSPDTVAQYATALARYRLAADQRRVSDAAPLISNEQSPYFVPWFWTTEDGATIRKRANGTFVVTSAQLLDNWYEDTECFSAGWPTYMCTDNQQRLMSAPDTSTIIFGDIEYKRSVPDIEVSADAVPLETSLTSSQTFGPVPKGSETE